MAKLIETHRHRKQIDLFNINQTRALNVAEKGNLIKDNKPEDIWRYNSKKLLSLFILVGVLFERNVIMMKTTILISQLLPYQMAPPG
jgi:hypothetical protein